MNAKTIARAQWVGTKDICRVAALPLTTTRASTMPGVSLLAGSTRWAQIRMGFRTIPLALMAALVIYLVVTVGLLLALLALLIASQGLGQAHLVSVRPTSRRGLSRLAENEGLPAGLKILATRKDDYGKTIKVKAPGSSTEAWKKKEAVLAGRFGVPARLFAINQDDNEPPNVFTLWIGKPGGRKTRSAFIPDVCDFHEPFRIGIGVTGSIVQAETFEYNTLISGIPGMGKTATVRAFILRNLLDPDGQTYLVDGKGSKKDYQDGLHAYSGYVNGTEDDALEQVLALLEHIHDMVNEANGADKRIKVLLVLDEWQDIRAGADKEMLKAIDKLITRIHKKGRATGLHLLLATQRASAVSIPTEMRSLFRQALAMRQKNGTDYGMVLGHAPDVAEPQGPGEGILSGDRGQTFVLIDHLSDEQWVSAVRKVATRVSMVAPANDTQIDPLYAAVAHAVRTHTQDEYAPSALYALLPEEVRPSGGLVWFGRWMGQQGVRRVGATYRRGDLLEVFRGTQ